MSRAIPDLDNQPFAEFLDDFFAECDEHLTLVRRGLVALEAFVQCPQIDHSLLDELFRGFHSLKGLASMVGVTEVEQLAHHMESYLRLLRHEQVMLNATALDTLIAGTRMIEQSISARRATSPAPDSSELLMRLAALTNAPATSAIPVANMLTNSEEQGRIVKALARGERIWQITFVPAPTLAQRNINVNTVRARLQTIGEIIRAVPHVTTEGGIDFEFLVAGQIDEDLLLDWRDDGITAELFAQHPVATTTHDPPLLSGLVPTSLTPSNVVRVDLGRLDDLMQMIGALIISRARLANQLAQLESRIPIADWRALQETNLALERQLRMLRTGVLHVRMVPIGDAFTRMQFIVHDLARELNKQVALELHGQDTEIDKHVVERMLDPLIQLVRNAVGHGLERPEERVAAGKPPTGVITLRAATVGDTVMIEIEDDGRGINAGQIAARARTLQLIDETTAFDTNRLLQILCLPGFSTRTQADRVSGRGVGMDVVQKTVHELGGTLALASHVGRGTRFTIQVPLTLAIMDALIVAVGTQTFAVPLPMVREIIHVQPNQITLLECNEIVIYHGHALPLVRLAQRFGIENTSQHTQYAFVVGNAEAAVGIVVDQLLGKREIVVRPINDPLVHVPGIAGATELADGRVVLILDTVALARQT